ncbi:MAG: rhomboid family intramembrane serine protease, partial [Gemmatimonadetes bacterium]
MFPYKDENPTELTPLVTLGIIALNVLAWLFLQGMGSEEALRTSVCQLGLIPGELLRGVPPGTPIPIGQDQLGHMLYCDRVVSAAPHWGAVLTSMFMHGGWFHLLGNMWFLWVFGNNIEDSMGHGRFVVFYLLCGICAAGLQMLVQPSSTVPMVGASGAISGVMGAYILLYPRVRVHTLVFLGLFATTVTVPAYLMLGYWILLQVLGGLPQIAGLQSGGVAFFAHIGGFAAGLLLIRAFAR